MTVIGEMWEEKYNKLQSKYNSLLERLEKLLEPEKIDPYWSEDPNWVHSYLESIIEDFKEE
jgi:hypothetical protein